MNFIDGPVESWEHGGLVIDIYLEDEGFGYVILGVESLDGRYQSPSRACTQLHSLRAVQTCATSASTILGSISGSGGGVSLGPM